jgi:hypothetical protein
MSRIVVVKLIIHHECVLGLDSAGCFCKNGEDPLESLKVVSIFTG